MPDEHWSGFRRRHPAGLRCVVPPSRYGNEASRGVAVRFRFDPVRRTARRSHLGEHRYPWWRRSDDRSLACL